MEDILIHMQQQMILLDKNKNEKNKMLSLKMNL